MDQDLQTLLAIAVVLYTILMLAISWWSRGNVTSTEDFLVAGRRLPLMLAFPTLLATWFGAGVLLSRYDVGFDAEHFSHPLEYFHQCNRERAAR